MNLDEQIKLLKQALEKTTNFNNEEEKINFILDVTNEYKRLLLHVVSQRSEL